MIELAAVAIAAAGFAAALRWLWSRMRPAPERRWRQTRTVVCLVMGVVVVGSLAQWIAGARSFQLLGRTVARVETTERVVALTFDDGPAPGATDEILQMLRDQNVVATFFLNGSSIMEHPREAEKLARAGHELGNHSYSHARLIGKPLSFVRDEIERTDELIRGAGFTGSIRFRPPYGKKFLVLPYYLWRSGRESVMWDVEPDSYEDVAESPDRIVAHVMERTRPGSIILLHVMFPSRRTSLEAVPGIISGLHAAGFRFVTVSELYTAERISRPRPR